MSTKCKCICTHCLVDFYIFPRRGIKHKDWLPFCSIFCRKDYVKKQEWLKQFRESPFPIEFYQEDKDKFGIPFILAYRIFKKSKGIA